MIGKYLIKIIDNIFYVREKWYRDIMCVFIRNNFHKKILFITVCSSLSVTLVLVRYFSLDEHEWLHDSKKPH